MIFLLFDPGEVYVIGGVGENHATTNQVELVNPKDGSVSELPSMLHARESLTAATAVRSIYVFGGFDAKSRSFSSKCEKYRPKSDRQV